MRVLVAVIVALSVGAHKPALEAAAKPVEPVELGQTVSSIDCPLKKAVYGEPQAGRELRFRAGKPWEMHGMTESVFDLVSPKGEVLWGEIASNMETSRDVGAVFYRSHQLIPL